MSTLCTLAARPTSSARRVGMARRAPSRRVALTATLAFVTAFGHAPLLAAPPSEPPSAPATDPATQAAHAALERGRLCWFAVDLPCAERELSAALAARESLTPPALEEVRTLLAELYLSTDRRDRARVELVELLTLVPTWSPAWPPEWLEVLAEARRLAPDRLPPALSAELPASHPAGRPLLVTARAVDPSGVGRVELVAVRRRSGNAGVPVEAVRPRPGEAVPPASELGRRPGEAVLPANETRPAGGEDAEHRLALATTDGETWRAELPPALTGAGRIALRLYAWDRLGNGPTPFPATAAHDLELVVPVSTPATSPPITTRWWFWAIIAGAAGGAVALALTLSGDDAPASSSGDLGVTLSFP